MKTEQAPRSPDNRTADAASTPSPDQKPNPPQGPGAVGYDLYDPARAQRRHGPGYCGWSTPADKGHSDKRR